MNVKLRTTSMLVLASFILSAASCGTDSSNEKNISQPLVNYSQAELGKECTDIAAEIKIITNRTDLIEDNPDGRDFQDYITEFNLIYPNIKVTYEGITNYDADMTTRLTSKNWGAVCSIPASVSKSDLETYFEPIADYSQLSDVYEFVEKSAFGGKIYGIPSTGNVQGIVYNKKIWQDAGIKELPVTPDEFIQDLKLIEEKTDAIPLYTNYAAGWSLTAWDAYIYGCATGDGAFKNQILPHKENPFAKQADNSGPYEIYNTLYRAVSEGLTEDDPTTTDWESSKFRINNGEIASMVLGSWAVPQMQSAGDNPDDIGYMPFPMSVNGQQFASASGDYCYGVNKFLSAEEKTAALLYVKFLTEKSGYAYDNGGVPIVKGEKLPEILSDFEKAEMIVDLPAIDGEEDFFTKVNNDSELSLDGDSTHVARIIEAAVTGSETFDDIMEDWNSHWSDAQKRNNIDIK